MSARTTLERADRDAAARAAPAGRHPWLHLLGRASEIADQPPLIALSAALLAGGLCARNRRVAEAGGRMLAAELVATGLKSAFKARVDRTRPQVEARGGTYLAGAGSSDDSDLNSFPSGHTAGAVATARALGRTYPAAALPALGVAGAIAAIQVPRGKHYPSDLVAGAAIGLVAEAAVHLTVSQVRRRLG